MEKIDLSIVIPVYNSEKWIRRCIDSIIEQDLSNVEVILVDDGSTDASFSICNNYTTNNKIKVIHKNNEGPVNARITGCNVAHGQYMWCIDADDWIEKDSIVKVRKILESYHPDIICFNYKEIIDNKDYYGELGYEYGYYDKNRIIDVLSKDLICNKDGKSFKGVLWNKIIRRDLFVYGYVKDSRLFMGEDIASTPIIINECNSLYIMADYLYNYNKNNVGSITKNRKCFDLSYPKIIKEHLLKMNNSSEFVDQIDRRTVIELYVAVESQFLDNDSYSNQCKKIRNTLNYTFYKESVDNAKFTFLSNGYIKRLLLKYKMFLIICLRIKNI